MFDCFGALSFDTYLLGVQRSATKVVDLQSAASTSECLPIRILVCYVQCVVMNHPLAPGCSLYSLRPLL